MPKFRQITTHTPKNKDVNKLIITIHFITTKKGYFASKQLFYPI